MGVIRIKILAFDQSITCTGWCIFCDSEYVGHGLIDLRTIDSEHRPQYMLNMIVNKIKSYEPDIVVLEDVVLSRNPKTLKDLAKLQGAVMGVCSYLNIRCEIIGCPTWRKTLGFKQGNKVKRPELKQQAHDYVVTNFGIETSEDECDAICIGWAYITQLKKESSI